ncbi:MAG: hypothetical protein JXB14_03475, partial [Candidatus Altiarchaeota archaeon]|nr:hypothetical protein [Candidatus Altiarchaeota archaeon]
MKQTTERLIPLLRQELSIIKNLVMQKEIIRQFQILYFGARFQNRTWATTYWGGVRVLKCPLDLWVYQEIINELKPDVIIETGTSRGGSALYLASICDFIGKGRVITIDLEVPFDKKTGRPVQLPKHDRITYIIGSSTSQKTVEKVKSLIKRGEKVL